MLEQNTKVHSSGLGGSIPVDLPLFPLAVTCMDGAPRDQSTSSDRETSPGAVTENPVHQHFLAELVEETTSQIHASCAGP